jgi:hypothetical protein
MDNTLRTRPGFVYHIPDPAHPNSLLHGYVGVSLNVRHRFKGHVRGPGRLADILKKTPVPFEDVKILFMGPMDECYTKENALRPTPFIGWNESPGGKGPNYTYSINKLKKIRSENQSQRMKDAKIKKRQAISFKRNYYADETSQKLRVQRAKEHMANPEKRQVCLAALHQKKKCPYCDHTNNAPNLARHIKKQHAEK